MRQTDKKTIIISIITLVTGLLAGWLIFGSNNTNTHEDHEHVKTEINGETVWTCSMHPQIRQTEPGDCPICGMDLIPLEDNQNPETDPMSVSMSPAAMKLASVSTAVTVQMKPVKQVRLNGKVSSDERLVYAQSSHIPGRIEDLLVDFTGEYVKKGQTIASVYSPELTTAQEELFEAKKMAGSQPGLFDAAKEKLKNWKLSDQQIEAILESGKIQEEFPVQADVSGYVTQKNVKPGDYVREGEAIYEVADLSRIWVLFDVYESDISWISKGDQVTFSIHSLPGESFKGIISYIDPVIDPKTRVAKARVEYNNAKGKLKPEMFASGVVDAELTGRSNSLVVPKTAVMWTGKRSVVYVKTQSDRQVSFKMREVILGPSLGDHYLIESGLKIGEEIAVSGTFSIDAAAQLAGKPSMMSPGGGTAISGHDHGGLGNGEHGSHDVNEEDPTSLKPLSIDNRAEMALDPLYETYLAWKDALVGDDFKAAKNMAADMQSVLETINMNLFEGDAHHAWMGYKDQLSKNLEHAPHYSGIAQLRKAFQEVSVAMIDITKTFRPLSKTIFVQHCPMADNNRGADWLSSEREIKNPYFGSSMLTCGEVTHEIK